MKKTIIYPLLVLVFIISAITLFTTSRNLTTSEIDSFLTSSITSLYPESTLKIANSTTSMIGHFVFTYNDIEITQNETISKIDQIKIVVPLWHIILGKGQIHIEVNNFKGVAPNLKKYQVKIPGLFRYATTNLNINNISIGKRLIERFIIKNINMGAPIAFEMLTTVNSDVKLLLIGQLDLPNLQKGNDASLKLTIKDSSDSQSTTNFNLNIDMLIRGNQIKTIEDSQNIVHFNALIDKSNGISLKDINLEIELAKLRQHFHSRHLDINNTKLKLTGSIDLIPFLNRDLKLELTSFAYRDINFNQTVFQLVNKKLAGYVELLVYQGKIQLKTELEPFTTNYFKLDIDTKDLKLPTDFRLRIPKFLKSVHNTSFNITGSDVLYQNRKHAISISGEMIDDILSIKKAKITRQNSSLTADIVANIKDKQLNFLAEFDNIDTNLFNIVNIQKKYLTGRITGMANGKIGKEYDVVLDLTVTNGRFYPFKIRNQIVKFAKDRLLDITIPYNFTQLKFLGQLTNNLFILKNVSWDNLELSGNLYLNDQESNLYLVITNETKLPFKLTGKGLNIKPDPNFSLTPFNY